MTPRNRINQARQAMIKAADEAEVALKHLNQVIIERMDSGEKLGQLKEAWHEVGKVGYAATLAANTLQSTLLWIDTEDAWTIQEHKRNKLCAKKPGKP